MDDDSQDGRHSPSRHPVANHETVTTREDPFGAGATLPEVRVPARVRFEITWSRRHDDIQSSAAKEVDGITVDDPRAVDAVRLQLEAGRGAALPDGLGHHREHGIRGWLGRR
jgi:hypothetical protein